MLRRLSGSLVIVASMLALTCAVSAAHASSSRAVVVAGTVSPCTDCSIAEGPRPRTMDFAIHGVGVVHLKGLDWKKWGDPETSAQGRATIETDGVDRGSVRITLSTLRRHLPDGCGNSGTGRIYTRAVIHLSGFELDSQNGSYSEKLSRTGCETS